MAVVESSNSIADTRPLSRTLGAFFFAVCAATYIVNAADRLIFPTLLRPLDTEYGFSLGQGSFLATVYLVGLGAGGIGTGYLIERVSRKSSMVAGILVYSLFTILTVRAFGFADMAFYRVMTGFGEALQSVALIITACAFYPQARTLANGLIQCALGIGQFIGPRLGAALLAATGDWRMPFYGFGALGLIGAAAVLFVSRRFTERRVESAAQMHSDAHIPTALWNRNVICVLLAVLFRSFPFFAFLGLYASFLMTELHFPLTAAAAALSMFGVGPLFSPLAGYIADRTNQKTFQIACFVTMAAAGFLIFNVAHSAVAQGALSLVEGVAGGFAYVNGYSLAQRSARNALIGRVSGWYYAASTLPAAVSGPVLASLVQALGWRAGATLMMCVSLVIPISISLLIDTTRISGRTRRMTEGARLFN